MADAYSAAASFMRDAMGSAPVKQNEIIVVRGDHDRIEEVFSKAGTPFKLIERYQIDSTGLSPEQAVFVNCLGEGLGQNDIRAVRNYVDNGGCLTTTDWALKSVVEKAFPGFIKYNGITTRNDVVEVRFCNSTYLNGLNGLRPQWWLEVQSFPIKILKKDVQVLIDSDEMKQKYNDGAIAVTFEYGKGRVFHMVSHYNLQQTKSSRKGMSAKEFAKEILGVSVKGELEQKLDGVSADQFEAAFSANMFVHNIVADRRK